MCISCDPSVGPTRIIELGKTLRLYSSLAVSVLGTKAAESGIYTVYVPSRRAKLLCDFTCDLKQVSHPV